MLRTKARWRGVEVERGDEIEIVHIELTVDGRGRVSSNRRRITGRFWGFNQVTFAWEVSNADGVTEIPEVKIEQLTLGLDHIIQRLRQIAAETAPEKEDA